MRSIYIAATGQHIGKTTMVLGLLSAIQAKGIKCQYFKPVGQRFFDHMGQRADEDVWLCKEVLGTQAEAEMMSPVIVARGYTQHYLENPEPERLRTRILEAEEYLRKDSDILVVEGTGHAGVGTCLDLSNAEVAALLNSVALLVVPGGVGRSLDEAALSLNLFKTNGVPMAGVVVNKVLPEKQEKVTRALQLGLERMGTRLLGSIPYEPLLECPTVEQIAGELKAKVICGKERMTAVVRNTIIAAMNPQNVLRFLKPGSLFVTPGDRIDNILLAISTDRLDVQEEQKSIAGIVLTGGLMPHMAIMPLLKGSGIPVLLCEEDTFGVSSKISHWVFKINPGDADKIAAAQRFVRDFVDVDAILSALEEAPSEGKAAQT